MLYISPNFLPDGTLTSIRTLNVDELDVYYLSVVARDLGRPPLRRTHVVIEI